MAQKIDKIENKDKKLRLYSCKCVLIIRYKLFIVIDWTILITIMKTNN